VERATSRLHFVLGLLRRVPLRRRFDATPADGLTLEFAMCEILVLVALSRYVVRAASEKNRSPTLFVILLIASWFVTECGGGIAGFLVGAILEVGQPGDQLIMYACALLGAAAGAAIVIAIVRSVPEKMPTDEQLDYDDHLDYDQRP
jgi:hypothetical protein